MEKELSFSELNKTEQMQYNSIQKSGLCLSAIGTGCWAFGGGDYWGAQDQKDATDVVHASFANGINYFDTAEAYNEGRSESSLGVAIKGLSRDKLIIGTKVSPSNVYASKLREHCEASLKRLQTDYIDIYMIHWPVHPHSIRHFTNNEQIISHPPTIGEAFETMLELRREGKIRHIGISNFSRNRMNGDIPVNVPVAVNQLPYNLLCRAIEFDTKPYCEQNGIGIIGYMTLLQGILTGKYPSLDNIPEYQRRTRHFNSKGTSLCRHGESGFETEMQTALNALACIASETGIKMSELATKWSIAAGITCSLVGARNAKQLEENVKAAEGSLDNEIITMLNVVTDELKQKLGNNFDYYENRNNDRTI